VANEIARQPPDDVADLLPAAWYVTAEHAQVRRRHRLLGFAILVIAVGASLAVPVAGVITITAGITVLRAADRATEGLAARRHARGPRRRDLFLLLASMPWLLVRAVAETILLVPLVLLGAAIAVAAATTATGGGHLALAAAAVAGVYTALSCLGPRSRSPRRQLNRFLDAIAPTPLTVGMIALMLGAVAAAVISLTVPGRPAFWPAHELRGALLRLPGLESGPCQLPPPAMRLTTLCAAPHRADQPLPRPTPHDQPQG
jgi:hypothetical protein